MLFRSHQLYGNKLRLSELKVLIPDISEKMLIQELKVLQTSNLVFRKNYGEVPPKVEYSLTESGNKTKILIEAMAEYAKSYEDENMKE